MGQNILKNMAGVAGLEPARDGIKIRCLTDLAIPQSFFGAGEGNRTLAISLEG